METYIKVVLWSFGQAIKEAIIFGFVVVLFIMLLYLFYLTMIAKKK